MISSDVRDIVSSLQRIARALEGINSSLRGTQFNLADDKQNENLEVTDEDPALLKLIDVLSRS